MKPNMLMILDGYGIAPAGKGNAIEAACKPNIDAIFEKYPNTTISACGEDVGLPAGQMGNSEVGHMNIGAGRIVYQELSRISNDVKSGVFFENPVLTRVMETTRERGKALHLMGLLSDGGVHSHIDHLMGLIEMAASKGLSRVFVHAFLDGRDVPPRCAVKYIKSCEKKFAELNTGCFGVVSGRYYAMDRDKHWERVSLAYDALSLGVKGKALKSESAEAAVEAAYLRDENDEFVRPTVVADYPGIEEGDGIIMFNFRPDRAREITRAFADPAFDGFERERSYNDLSYVCMTTYDATIPNVEIAYPPEEYKNTLGEYLSSLGLKQLRIAETEKYAHVTFFFNGGVEKPNEGEERILVPSPAVATYDLKPEMSAFEVRDRVLEAIESDKYDVIIINFANADMVGHTGVFDAARRAIEALDKCVPEIADAVLEKGGQILLTADHGNADVMLDDEGNIVTSHSLSKVPLVHISREPKKLREGGRLSDLAPTLLSLMGLAIPKEMTGRNLAE